MNFINKSGNLYRFKVDETNLEFDRAIKKMKSDTDLEINNDDGILLYSLDKEKSINFISKQGQPQKIPVTIGSTSASTIGIVVQEYGISANSDYFKEEVVEEVPEVPEVPENGEGEE